MLYWGERERRWVAVWSLRSSCGVRRARCTTSAALGTHSPSHSHTTALHVPLIYLQVEYTPDYIGFDCPNRWVAGLGMDTNQLFREIQDVVVLTPEAINRALER